MYDSLCPAGEIGDLLAPVLTFVAVPWRVLVREAVPRERVLLDRVLPFFADLVSLVLAWDALTRGERFEEVDLVRLDEREVAELCLAPPRTRLARCLIVVMS